MLKVLAVKCDGDSCLGAEWAVLEALVPDGTTLGRGRRLLYATKDGHSEHRWVAGELRGESEGVARYAHCRDDAVELGALARARMACAWWPAHYW